MSLISIITPCFNAGSLIRELAESLELQSFKDFEWIVVDDGSETKTKTILNDIELRSQLKVRVLSQTNQGGNVCRNRGFLESNGRFVKFVDADDLLEPELLAEQINIARSHENCLVVSPTKVLCLDNRSFTIPLCPMLLQNPLKSYLSKPSFMHGGCLLPRQLVDAAGMWDERLKAGQDVDFFRRVLARNPPVIFSGSHFIYRQHDQAPRISNLSGNDHSKFQGHLIALDSIVEILTKQGRLNTYSTELARSYDTWGFRAAGFNMPIANEFSERAKSLDRKNYRSGSRYTKFLRSFFGDRIVAKLIRSRLGRQIHGQLVRCRLWPLS